MSLEERMREHPNSVSGVCLNSSCGKKFDIPIGQRGPTKRFCSNSCGTKYHKEKYQIERDRKRELKFDE